MQAVQLSGIYDAHDPSEIVQDGSNDYYYSTGQGILAHTSTNLTTWAPSPAIFGTVPAWTTAAVPGFTGDYWAPDVAYFNNTYHVYYSASLYGANTSAIGLVTSPSLSNPTWTDQNKVIQSDAAGSTRSGVDTTRFNAIDPSVLVDQTTGRVWMSWGSYSSGIEVTELNATTGQRLNTASLTATLVANNAASGGSGSSIEASYLMQRGGYYYLFVNYGQCCSGVSSTYNIRVGRSTSPTGPFVDQSGVNMTHGGGTTFLQDNGNQIGPGQFGYLSTGGQDYFSYHYYNGDANGAPTLGLRQLSWTTDGWPSVAAANPNWTGGTSVSWSTAANWSANAVPNGTGAVANFGAASAARYGVTLDSAGETLSTVNFSGTAAYTIGTSGGGTLTLGAASGDPSATINVADLASHTIAAPISATSNLGVNVKNAGSTLTLSGTVSGLALAKYGFGTLSLGGGNNYSGSVLVHQGTLDVTGSVVAGAFTSVGQSLGDNATLTVRGTGSFASNADLNVGDTGDAHTVAAGTLNVAGTAAVTVGAGGGLYVGSGYSANTLAVGTVNQTGGTVTANGNFDGGFVIGGRGSSLAVGTYNLGGGTVNANTNLRLGGYGTGTINQTGGTFNASGYASVGRYAGATGTWNLSGGTLNQTTAGPQLIVGESGTGTLAVSGSGQAVLASPLQLGRNADGVGIVHLDGGTVTAPQVARGAGSATAYFNGGTLRVSANSFTYLQGLTNAYVQAGGAVIDTQAFNVTVAQPLLHDPALTGSADGGLTKVGTGTLTLVAADTYTGPTTVGGGRLTLPSAGAIPATSSVYVGTAAGVGAAVYQTGGTVTNTNPALGGFQIGSAAGAAGYYSLSGGTLNPAGEVDVGGSGGGTGTVGRFDLTGGTVNLPNGTVTYFLPNRGGPGETSVVNVTGGTVQIAGGGTPADNGINGLAVNWSGAGAAQTATVTIANGGQFLTPSLTVKLNNGSYPFNGQAGNAANLATLNLTAGGTLQTLGFSNGVGNNGNVAVNFNGGTLRAGTADNPAFLHDLGATVVYGGGGTVDNNGRSIAIGQAITGPAGLGVTGVAVTAGGTGYVVPPQVTFVGGGGSGATGYTSVNAATGAVTGIVVTSPGTGYTSAPTVALTPSGGGTGATVGTVNTAANAAGTLTFLGAGTTTLNGPVTAIGITTAGNGTVNLGPAPVGGSGIQVRSVGAVDVSSGTLALVPSAGSTNRQLLVTPSLSVAGKLDVGNGDVLVHNGSLSALTAAAAVGFAGGTLGGANGITSTATAADARHLSAVGIVSNVGVDGTTALYTSFDGQAASAADVLIRYTYFGDTNLDGRVDVADYTRIDYGYVAGLTGWANGDFNYDGVVDGSDYALMDNAFNQQAGGFTAPADIVASPTSASAIAGGTVAVPEPSALSALAGIGGMLATRSLRRRRRVR